MTGSIAIGNSTYTGPGTVAIGHASEPLPQPEERMTGSRVAVLLDDDGRPTEYFVAMPSLLRTQKTGHVSGNQIDVLHCPFCGSGAIVSRSDGSIQCTFCNAGFTVTVAPLYSAFPQSVGGQPYPWPGRPDGGMDPSMMQMGDEPGGGYGGQLIPGGGGDAADGDNPFDPDGDGDDEGDEDEDGDGNPFAGDSGDSSGGGDDDEKEAEVGGKKKPPFGKKSSMRVYKTAYGGIVPPNEYLKHLALVTAKDPNAVAAKIRAERGA